MVFLDRISAEDQGDLPQSNACGKNATEHQSRKGFRIVSHAKHGKHESSMSMIQTELLIPKARYLRSCLQALRMKHGRSNFL